MNDRIIPGALLRFRNEPNVTSRRWLEAWPQNIFRGDGLWIWGANETTLIHQITIGNRLQYSIDGEAIPALFFKAGMPYAEFNELVKDDQRQVEWLIEHGQPNRSGGLSELTRVPKLPAHQCIKTDVTEIGNSVRLEISGPITHVVMWGVTIK